MALQCQKCGYPRSPASKFCIRCGEELRLKCLKCLHINAIDSKSCVQCGYDFSSDTAVASPTNTPCPNCGATNETDSAFCSMCGRALTSQPKPTSTPSAAVPIETAALGRRCHRCSATNEHTSGYCYKCGAELATLSTAEAASGASGEQSAAAQPRLGSPFTTPLSPSGGSGLACPRCGTANDSGSQYCQKCGLPMDAAASTGPFRDAPALAAPGVEPAGLWIRVLASIIDGIVLTLFIYLPIRIIVESPDLEAGLEVLFGAAYSTILVSWQGATIGKMALGLRVVRADGEKVEMPRALVRWFGYILSALILLIGYFMVGFREDKRGLHDLIADTVVVRRRPL